MNVSATKDMLETAKKAPRTVPENLHTKLAKIFIEPQSYNDTILRKDAEAWQEEGPAQWPSNLAF